MEVLKIWRQLLLFLNFAADHTTVEWKLDVYDDNGTRTAVVATDRDPYGVDNGVYAQNKLSVKGEKVIDIHSHLPGGTERWSWLMILT